MADLAEMMRNEFSEKKTPDSLDALLRKEFASPHSVARPIAGTADSSNRIVPEESLGAPGLGRIGSMGVRFSVSEGRNFEEKYRAFKAAYPDGELLYAPTSNANPFNKDVREVSSKRELLFRKSQNEPFAKVKDTAINAPLGAMVDFLAQDIGSIIGQTLSVLPQGRSLSVLPLMLKSFAGGAAGDVAQQGVQQARGINTEGTGDVVAGGAMRGIGAAVGAGIGAGIARVKNAIKGGGLMDLERGGAEAIKSAERLGVPSLITPQVALNPVMKRAAAQSAGSSGILKKYIDDQGQAALRAMDSLQSKGSGNIAMELAEYEARQRAAVLQLDTLNRRVEAPEAGRRIQQAIDKWNDASTTNVNTMYERARAIENPVFDFRNAQKLADEIKAGVQSRGLESGEIVKVSRLPQDSDLGRIIETIKSVHPDVSDLKIGDKTVKGFDQINYIRRQLYDLKTAPEGTYPREHQRIAGKLYAAVTETIQNPVNANPQFKMLWNAANNAASTRFQVLDKLVITKAIKSETPSQLAERLTAPGNAENLAVLQRLRQPHEFDSVRDFFKSKLMDDPIKITQTLDAYDKPTLNLLLSKEDQLLYRSMGDRLQRLEVIMTNMGASKYSANAELAASALRSGSSKQIADAAMLVQQSGGIDSPIGRAMRNGIIDDIAKESIISSKGGHIIDSARLTKVVGEYEKAGLSKFLTPTEITHLKDQRVVAAVLKTVEDAGASMASGENAGNVVFRTSQKAIYHMARLMGFGRLMTMPSVTNFLIGAGKAKDPAVALKVISGALGTSIADLERME